MRTSLTFLSGIVCWLAEDHETLEEIRKSDDIYEAFAVRFGLWDPANGSLRENDKQLRQTVKGMVLGCGYGASAKKYAMIMKCSLEEAERSVSLYQKKMSKVVKLWKKYNRQLKLTAESSEYRIDLPSGNAIVYRNVARGTDSLTCTLVRNGKPMVIRPWYGMITENCSQSLARDIFCQQLTNIEKAGHKIILHVHDEVIIECAETEAQRTLDEVVKIMSTPPSWISDIPLSAEGAISNIYTK